MDMNDNPKKRSREDFEGESIVSNQDGGDNNPQSDNDEDQNQKPMKLQKLSDNTDSSGESGGEGQSPLQTQMPTQITTQIPNLGNQMPNITQPLLHTQPGAFQMQSHFPVTNPLGPQFPLNQNLQLFQFLSQNAGYNPNLAHLFLNPQMSAQMMNPQLSSQMLNQNLLLRQQPQFQISPFIPPPTQMAQAPLRKKPQQNQKKKKKKDDDGEEEEEVEAPTSTTDAQPTSEGYLDPKDETQRQRARRLIKLSKDDLKKKCKENGLILSGKKGELVQRLMHPENPLNKKNLQSVNILTARKVEQVLRNAGVENPKACSQCLRGAIQLNKIKLLDKEILDSELVTEPCPNCKTEMTATVRDVLNQPDSAIGDDLRQHAPYKCPGCGQGYYITKICLGTPTFDDGKQHHHCTKCPGFGICLGDVNQQHCQNCGEHYLNGMTCAFCGEENEEPQANPMDNQFGQ